MAECCYAECHNAECRYSKCLKYSLYAGCRYAECRGVITNGSYPLNYVILLSKAMFTLWRKSPKVSVF
jgi:hypothetical protein